MPGQIPVRYPNHTGMFPVELTHTNPWPDYLGFYELPHRLNPPEGFIASANNRVSRHCSCRLCLSQQWPVKWD
jgi:penicillin amidase